MSHRDLADWMSHRDLADWMSHRDLADWMSHRDLAEWVISFESSNVLVVWLFESIHFIFEFDH